MKTKLCYFLIIATSWTMTSQDTSLDMSIPLAKIQKVLSSLEGKKGDNAIVSYTINENTITQLYKADYGDELKIMRYTNIAWYRMYDLELNDDDDTSELMLSLDKAAYLENGYKDSPNNDFSVRNYIVVDIPKNNKDKIKAHFYELQKVAQTIAKIGGDGWDIYEKQNNLDTAISKSLIAIKHYPSLNWVQANLGLFYWLKGDIKNSKLYYSEAIRQIVSVQDPDNMEALVKDIYDAQAKYPNITNFPELITFLENELLKYE
ncbi:hypothetical protein [Aquaticitalea lipolytica]|uniref:hypothetical protein n=1 Tax=Aquaticitalea lipolytica TaxID=1247562 RepID=UPI0024B947CE|nr:hypothetical protein [Aquaticitalea lipolytica]